MVITNILDDLFDKTLNKKVVKFRSHRAPQTTPKCLHRCKCHYDARNRGKEPVQS